MIFPARQNTSSLDIYPVVLVIQNQAKVQSLTNFTSLRDLKTGRHSWWFCGGRGIRAFFSQGFEPALWTYGEGHIPN